MDNQKHLFQLPADIHYLNCAYMAPQLKSVEARGIAGMQLKRQPGQLRSADFFDGVEAVKSKFARLVSCDANEVALIPSVSYGLANVLPNILGGPEKEVLVVADEFPSGYFAAERWCQIHGAQLRVVTPDHDGIQKGESWNHNLLQQINERTAMVVLSAVHWMTGTQFELERIGERCQKVGARFIVDGTQAVGAQPIDVRACQIDALICAAYKWLMGPYSSGLAYYGPAFHDGQPAEESWMNRTNAAQFSQLNQYDPNYKAGAARFTIGEATNFVLTPMLDAGLEQILDWGVDNIQQYCEALLQPLIQYVEGRGQSVEDVRYRSAHLLSLQLPDTVNPDALVNLLRERNILVSLRGTRIRVAPHLYNTPEDIQALIQAIDEQWA